MVRRIEGAIFHFVPATADVLSSSSAHESSSEPNDTNNTIDDNVNGNGNINVSEPMEITKLVSQRRSSMPLPTIYSPRASLEPTNDNQNQRNGQSTSSRKSIIGPIITTPHNKNSADSNTSIRYHHAKSFGDLPLVNDLEADDGESNGAPDSKSTVKTMQAFLDRNTVTKAMALVTAPTSPKKSVLSTKKKISGTTPPMLGAKPSEIRAAAKQQRDVKKFEQFRKDKIRQREAEAAIRMQKIKDEIDAIKAREIACDAEALAQVQQERQDSTMLEGEEAAILVAGISATMTTPTTTASGERCPPRETRDMTMTRAMACRPVTSIPTRKKSTAEETEAASKGAKELAMEEMMVERQSAELTTPQHQQKQKQASDEDFEAQEKATARALGEKTMLEMTRSFSVLMSDMPMDELQHFRRQTVHQESSPTTAPPSPIPLRLGTTEAPGKASPQRPRRKELEATTSGKLRKVPSRRRLDRTPSNRVPEMRRRANQRDLIFDEDEHNRQQEEQKSAKTKKTIGEEESFEFHDFKAKFQETEKQVLEKRRAEQNNLQISKTAVNKSVMASYRSGSPATTNINLTRTDTCSTATSTSTDSLSPRSSSPIRSSIKLKLEISPMSRLSISVKTKSSMLAARDAKEAAKKESEKAKQQAQKDELHKARENFDKGHDLCWKCNDSASALVEYRKSLFTRESLLGKYHEETGRSYFWIGKSLTKLKEYDEALMAFSRAMRIFERVLKRSNKYNIWAVTAVESVFRQMDDPEVDFTGYKESLAASIRHEQEGDQFRKKGKLAEALASYRESIDNLEEYHPDAADLYCKIAIILRQQGEFDRALEEYRYASEIYELSLGAEHPETVKTLNQLIEKKRLNQKSMALMEKLNLGK